MESICDLLERLDEILTELEKLDVDDELHIALEIGYQFRDELDIQCEE